MHLSSRHCARYAALLLLGCGGATVERAPTSSTPNAVEPSAPPADAGPDAGPVCTGFDEDARECNACEAQACCRETANCQNDAMCTAIVACFIACSDVQCIGECESEHPGGADLFAEWAQCRVSQCATPCAK